MAGNSRITLAPALLSYYLAHFSTKRAEIPIQRLVFPILGSLFWYWLPLIEEGESVSVLNCTTQQILDSRYKMEA